MTGTVSAIVSEQGLHPRMDRDLPTLFSWLRANELTYNGSVFDRSSNESLLVPQDLNDRMTWAQSTGRHTSTRLTSEELKTLKEQFKEVQLSVSQDALWGAVLDPANSVRSLSRQKLPAEAMAFYRPFHLPPFDQWGHLFIDRTSIEIPSRSDWSEPESAAVFHGNSDASDFV